MAAAPESINGYCVLTPFRTAGGGQSRWATGRHGDRTVFIKQFLAPTYPVADSPGSAATKRRKMARCRDFEVHHANLRESLDSVSAEAGNLVVTEDFFRSGSHYYKVTEWVEPAGPTLSLLPGLRPSEFVSVLLTLTQSVRVLHARHLVHGDLKPENVLVKRLGNGRPVAKLIDFDNAFRVGSPPVSDELVGDPYFYSPELLHYVATADSGSRIGPASDVFALGLVFACVVGGRPPTIVGADGYPATALAAGGRLHFHARTELAALVRDMTSVRPEHRPSAADVHRCLKLLQRTVANPGSATRAAVPGAEWRIEGGVPSPRTATPSRLRGTMVGRLANARTGVPTGRRLGTEGGRWRCTGCDAATTRPDTPCEVCHVVEVRARGAWRVTEAGTSALAVCAESEQVAEAVLQAFVAGLLRPGQRLDVQTTRRWSLVRHARVLAEARIQPPYALDAAPPIPRIGRGRAWAR